MALTATSPSEPRAATERPRAGTDQPPPSAGAAPRVLFVVRSIQQFSYYDSIISALIGRGAEVEVAFDYGWSKKWQGGDRKAVEAFRKAHPGLTISWSARRSDKRRARIFALRELRTYRSYLTRRDTTGYYVNRWRQHLDPRWQARSEKALWRALLASPPAGLMLRLAEDLTPPDAGIVDFIRQRSPDVLVAGPLNLRYSEEIDYLKAARRLGVPTATPVVSWDNLSTKGLIQVAPDRLFVWNEHHLKDALDIHGLARSRIEIAGAPFFDKWFEPAETLPSREEFCRRLGLDPDRRILLYLGSSRKIAANEVWFVQKLRRFLGASRNDELRSCQLLVRPHPANAKIYDDLAKDGVCVFPKGGELPETREGFTQMRASFHHAAAAVGINTSGMVDAVLSGLPTCSVRLPRYADTQSDSVHFRHLESGDALYLSDNLTAFCETLIRLFAGEDPKAENRRAFARKFARPRGLERSAGDVIAESVLTLAKRR
jgi:hypothetical protein